MWRGDFACSIRAVHAKNGRCSVQKRDEKQETRALKLIALKAESSPKWLFLCPEGVRTKIKILIFFQ